MVTNQLIISTEIIKQLITINFRFYITFGKMSNVDEKIACFFVTDTC